MFASERDDRPGPPDRRAIKRLWKAYAELLAVLLVAVSAASAMALWHLVRRGRLIRARLSSPRPIRWPDEEPSPPDEDPTRIEDPS